MRDERRRDENAEPTFEEILRQEKLPGTLKGYTDPLKMWVRHDGKSVIPDYNRDLLPSPREIKESMLERKKRLAEGIPEPKGPFRFCKILQLVGSPPPLSMSHSRNLQDLQVQLSSFGVVPSPRPM